MNRPGDTYATSGLTKQIEFTYGKLGNIIWANFKSPFTAYTSSLSAYLYIIGMAYRIQVCMHYSSWLL
jgi:hypothetical protein